MQPTQTPMLPGLGGAPVNSGPINFGAANIAPPNTNGVMQNEISDTPGGTEQIYYPPGMTPNPALKAPDTTSPLSQGTLSLNNPNVASQENVNPSVVDLLNNPQSLNMNADLSKYGTSSAQPSQTQDMAQKYTDAFNANKSQPTPDTGAEARGAIDSYLGDQKQNQPDPQQNFFDQQSSMNPIVKNMYDQINQLLSPQTTQQTFQQQYTDLVAQQGIPALQTQLMNIQNIMKGTEDDIRTEITKAGGFATESQVAALTAARNKVLQTQATSLQNQLQMKDDYVNQIMQFSEADRAEVDKQVEQKLGLDEKVADMEVSLNSAAKDNYDKIVANIGYSGLAKAFGGDLQGMAQAENILGLPQGALSNPAFLAATPGSTTNTQFTLTPGSKRFDANGNVIASVPATGSSGGGGSSSYSTGSDPITDSWVSNVLNGNATMAQVPAALRNDVSLGLINQPTAAYSPLAASRFTIASNRIVSNFINLPQYQLTANGLPYLQRIDAAMKNPGSISDQDLLDSLTKLNTAGNAISDAQVRIITDGKSFSDMYSTFQNKFNNGGVLSDNQRNQIQAIAKAIYANYAKGYQPVYDQAVSQLQAAGIPRAFWTIPDLNNLSAQIDQQTDQSEQLPGLGGAPVNGVPNFGSYKPTNFQQANGVTYTQGPDGLYYAL